MNMKLQKFFVGCGQLNKTLNENLAVTENPEKVQA